MKLRSIIALFLVMLLLAPSLVGCMGAGTPADTTGGSSDATTAESTTTVETPEPEVLMSLVTNGVTNYKVIRSDSCSNEIAVAAKELADYLNSVTGATFAIANDWYNSKKEQLPEKACEILIGKTNRVESQNAAYDLREEDFVVCEENDRIVVMGGNDRKTLEAIQYFKDNYVSVEEKNVSIIKGEKATTRFNYGLGSLKIEGVSIREYTVIYPKDATDLFPYNAALNLVDYVKSELGFDIKIADDSTAVSEYEICIGYTNRQPSLEASSVSLTIDEYILKRSGKSLYMLGKSFMVGGGVSELINAYIGATGNNKEVDVTGIPETNEKKTFVFPEKATSALLLIGDGMGQNHIEATYKGRDDHFLAEDLINQGKCTTYSASVASGSASYTDSAASATALATGYKTKNGYLGLNSSKATITNVRELASKNGAKTAILTTDAITGATPSGFLCHHNDRNDGTTLQSQINNLRKTDKNLLFAVSVKENKANLVPEARTELYTISRGGSTFFAMFEEAYIDKESHNNNLSGVKTTVLRYNALIAYCVEFVVLHPSTALVITADHECGSMTSTGGFNSTNHTNTNVPVFAIGPGTEMFKGTTVDNTDIAKFLAAAFTEAKFGDQSLGKK